MNNSNIDISIIIPCYNEHEYLYSKLCSVIFWTLKPKEIVLVDSSDNIFNQLNKIKVFFNDLDINLIYIHVHNLYPGKARNFGVKYSNFSLIAFLDVHTIPQNDWLSLSFAQYSNLNNDVCIFGSTKYSSNNFISNIIKFSTFGNQLHTTLPGSILSKSIFYKVGQFIEYTRAGEDTDWIKRYELHGFKIINSCSILTYDNLDGLNLWSLIKKWFRNYSYAANLPYLNAHKNIYFYFIILIALFSAFNWNWVVANWDVNSPYYIPHITKLFSFFIFLIYFLFRCFYLPYRKGVSFLLLLKGFWLPVFIISIIIDLVKIVAFIYARLKNA